MPYRSAAEHEDVPRPVVGIGNDYPPSFELAEHRHRRGQLLYAANGVVAVSTPQGAWVAPPERAVWIPGGTPHAVRMVGAVQTRSVLIEPSACPALGGACRVVAVSPLLRQLLLAAAEIPVEYDEGGRDGLVMRLLVVEIELENRTAQSGKDYFDLLRPLTPIGEPDAKPFVVLTRDETMSPARRVKTFLIA